MSAKKNGRADQDNGCTGLQNLELLVALAAPFPESLVGWVVMATRQRRRGKQGLVVPYADPRAYTDRLNHLVTAARWTHECVVEVGHGFERRKKGVEHRVAAAKVLVVCKLTIFNLGTHSGTSEAWADDENAMTAAEAQAFRRACSCFGLDAICTPWVELDEYERPLSYPDLPFWERPSGGSGQKPGSERGGIASAEPENTGARRGTLKPANAGVNKTEPSSPAWNGSTNGTHSHLLKRSEGSRGQSGRSCLRKLRYP